MISVSSNRAPTEPAAMYIGSQGVDVEADSLDKVGGLYINSVVDVVRLGLDEVWSVASVAVAGASVAMAVAVVTCSLTDSTTLSMAQNLVQTPREHGSEYHAFPSRPTLG